MKFKKRLIVKEKFYYLRRTTKSGAHRCGVVFLILGDNVGARGVSFCNELDPFSKISGINKAKGRAMKAFKRKENFWPILREEAVDKLQSTEIGFKSEYSPTFTDFEIDILSEKRT